MTARRAQGLALAGLVLAAAAVWGAFGQRLDVPTVFGDEQIYWDAGRSLAAGDGLRVREGGYGFGPLYPAVLAVVHLVAPTDLGAYQLVRLVNALLFALASVPVYLLAARLLPRRWSLGVAALAVAAPSGVYTGFVMTEGAAYACACLAFLACAVAIERPTVRRQLLAIAAIALATGVRTQLAVIAVALLGGLVVDGLLRGALRRPGRADLAAFWPLLAACGVGLLALGARAATGDALAGYDALWRSYDLVETLRWTARALGGLGLYLALVALVAAPDAARVLLREARAGARPAGALLALGATATACFLLVVGAFSSTEYGVGFLHDRYLFYVVPLWLVALGVWAHRGVPVSRVALAAGTGVALAVVLPLAGSLLNKDGGRQLDAIASALPAEIAVRLGRNDPSLAMLAAAVLAAAAAVLLVPRRARWSLLVLVGAVFVANGALVADTRVASAENGPFPVLDPEHTAWVDRAVPDGARVVLLAPPVDVAGRDALRLTEFFNGSVGRVVALLGYELTPTTAVDEAEIDADGDLVAADGSPLEGTCVVAPRDLGVVGVEVARGTTSDLVLVRTDGRVRVARKAP